MCDGLMVVAVAVAALAVVAALALWVNLCNVREELREAELDRDMQRGNFEKACDELTTLQIKIETRHDRRMAQYLAQVLELLQCHPEYEGVPDAIAGQIVTAIANYRYDSTPDQDAEAAAALQKLKDSGVVK